MSQKFFLIYVASLSLVFPLFAADYNFNIDDNSQTTKPDKKSYSESTRSSDKDSSRTFSTKKDTVSSADVFALFKGEQKVTIVSKKEERVQDAPATIYVITDKEIQERGYLFLHDALRDVPGIDFSNDLGTYGEIAMQRGMDTAENNRTLIFIDGIPTNNPSQGVSYMSYQFALHDVKRIEILWGPASALYGANAFAGIINIVTKNSKDLEAEGKLGHVSAGTLIPKLTQTPTPAGAYFDFLMGSKMWDDKDAARVTVSGHYIRSDTGPNYARKYSPVYSNPPLSPTSAVYIPDNVPGMPILGDYQAHLRFEYKDFTLGARAWHINSRQGAFSTYYKTAYELTNWGFQGQDLYAKWNPKISDSLSFFSQIVFRAGQKPDEGYGNHSYDADRSSDLGPGKLLWYKRDDYALSWDNQLTADWSLGTSSLGVFAEYAKVSNWNTNDENYKIWNGSTFVQRYPREAMGDFDANGNIVGPNYQGFEPQDDKPEIFYNQYDFAAYLQHRKDLLQNLSLTLGARGDVLMLKGVEGPEVVGTNANCSGCSIPTNPRVFATDADAAAAGAELFIKGIYFARKPVDQVTISLNPRIGLVYNPTPNQTIKVLHGWAFRNPTVRERYSYTGSRIPIGNDLKPEQIKTTEIGYSVRPIPILRAEIDGFWSEVSDVIQLTSSSWGRPGKSTLLNQFQNVGSARLLGFELKGDLALMRTEPLSILVFANYSFQHNRYTEILDVAKNTLSHDLSTPGDKKESYAMPRVSTHKFNLGFTFYIQRYFSLSPIAHFVGARPNVVTNPIEEVPSYVLMNLSAAYRNPQNNWEASLFVFNILDQLIDEPGRRDASGAYYAQLHPIERLTVWARLTYKI
ncbi:MAG: Vitamin B12 transporter BtuB [Turneriella sp.]|nr:Vitamin B12 transporter BtuB [Turneriella sp.]